MDNKLSSELISQPTNATDLTSDQLVLLSDTGHNNIYRYVKDGRIFALKAVKPTCKDSELYRQFLYREYQLLSNLQSPFIVSVWQMTSLPEIGECMMMEYIDGRTLDRFVEERPSAALRRQVLDELLQAIDYLHRKQIVHADLKPQNILITNNGNHVKLIDLGLADSDSWRENNIGNTRQYAAPEQLNAQSKLDQRTDIYALGHIIRLVFPLRYRSIARKCLCPNPASRYQSISQLKNAINHQPAKVIIWIIAFILCLAAIVFFSIPQKGKQQPIIPIAETDTVVSPAQDSIVTIDSISTKPTKLEKPIKPEKLKEPIKQTNPENNIPQEEVFDIDRIRQKAIQLHIQLRDDCIRDIERPTTKYSETANRIFNSYRGKSQQMMMDEIRKFPEHDMEIAIIYDSADNFIFALPALQAVNNLPSELFVKDHPGVKVPASYKPILEDIGKSFDALYDRFNDSINNLPDRLHYKEFVSYYIDRANILTHRELIKYQENYPEKKVEMENILYHSRKVASEKRDPKIAQYPFIREADSALVWSLEKENYMMRRHLRDE